MTTCHDIQLWWELPSIAHFCSLFRAAFNLLDFDIEDLEEAILTDGLDGSGSPLLVELLVRLLQGCLPGRSVTPSNVDSCLRKLFRQKCQENLSRKNLLPEGDFRRVSLRRKVEILHALCDLRLEAEDVLDLLKNLETESLRVEPLGYDDIGATYWYFYGTRLYREDHSHYHPFRRRPKQKKKKKRKRSADADDEISPVWQVECFTEEDWNNLAERFECRDSRLERGLLQTLKDDFLPEIPRLFEEKEKRRMMEFTSRRSSGRVQKLKEKKEEEKRLAEVVVEHKKKKVWPTKKRTFEEEEGIERNPVQEEIEVPFEKEDSFEELLHSFSPVDGRKSRDRRERKERKSAGHKEVHRRTDWEEDVLQERNLSPQPTEPVRSHKPQPTEPARSRKPYKRKEPKNHIRKHDHPRKHGHPRKNHRSDTVENQEEVHVTSDASNKENNCVGEVFSEAEEIVDFPEDSDKPKVFCGRKTNNSLSSLAFSLTPSTVVPEAASHIANPTVMKKKVKSTQMILQNEEELRTGMYKILEHLGDHEDAWPFLESVEEAFAPNYYAVIRRPMYITKMEQRLDSGFYSSLSMFEADFKLMMDNCKLYNGPDSEYTHMAYNLERVFSKLKEKYLETDYSSDDEICIDMTFDKPPKKKKKLMNVEEVEVKDETEKKKRGRKKKKVGRKPKNASHEESLDDTSSLTRRKDRRSRTAEELPIPIVERNDDKLSDCDKSYDDDDLEQPMLLVREDPYCNDKVDDELCNYENGLHDDTLSNEDNISDIYDRKRMRRKTATKVETATKVDEQNDVVIDAEKISLVGKPHKGRRKHHKSNSRKRENSPQKAEINHKKVESPIREPSPLQEHHYLNSKVSDSDIDSDQDGVLLYYNNDPESELEDENVEEAIEAVSYKEDIDREVPESQARKHSSKISRKHRSPEKSHHHHRHHHHHKNRGKDTSKHHHHHHKRKPKHSSEKDSPKKKILRTEEVYDSEDNHHNLSASHDKNPEPVPTVDERSISPSKKKKARRKTRHHKSTKHKVDKVEKTTKNSSRRKKKVPSKKMAAIEALSAVTEQTLKDITTLLDDPSVPRFNEEEMVFNGSAETPAKEYDTIAMQIEEEYRKKLQLDASEEKKLRKRKRKKDDADKPATRKKCKKEPKAEVSSDVKSDTTSLDNAKELFKDIKDGRIKPGAIIKSKDIAKKEGQVKKDTKAAVEGKVKAKQSPFGKINKQENTKLTTLIAKAKESRVGLVPNSEVGDSPKLSLGSILQFGDIGSCKQSSREPNSPEEDIKFEKQSEKYESPYENRWEKSDLKEESSQSPEDEEEEPREEIEVDCEESPINVTEEVSQSPLIQEPQFQQEKATPNLSAWFRAFGGPKVGGSPRKKMNGRIEDDEYLDVDNETEFGDDINVDKDDDEQIDVDDNNDIKADRPNSLPPAEPKSPRQQSTTNSPQPPLSPVKPPETPWFHKSDDKIENEPIWKKNTADEDEDPYKFEEEELDRAREEAKKLAVERQRKASVSSSGLSDPSPLNIDSDRSPAAFSSEGERSPMTRSPATRSPMTPGFGGAKQFSPVTEKSPGVTAFSPRYDITLAKGFSSNQTNGPLKVGFYQDMSDKTNQEKKDSSNSLDIKQKESPIYSPTVPYVSPFYPSKDQAIGKQKSPGRFSSFYSSIDSLDKPKTPGYSVSDKPSPVTVQSVPDDKQKNKYNYYNYDPTKPLTDQYKSTGAVAKPFYGTDNNMEQSPGPNPSHISMGSPVANLGPQGAKTLVKNIPDLQPPKKRSTHNRSQVSSDVDPVPCDRNRNGKWEHRSGNLEMNQEPHDESLMPISCNLANLSQVVSKIPQPNLDLSKHLPLPDNHRSSGNIQQQTSKTVYHNVTPFNPSGLPDLQHPAVSNRSNTSRLSQNEHTAMQELSLHQQLSVPPQLSPHLLGKEISTLPIVDHATLSHLHPPVAHQKGNDADRPRSRNMPPPNHSSDKPPSYLHQKTMWTSSLPSSIANSLSSSNLPSSLSSLVTNATMASFALAGQKGFGSLSSDHFAQLGVDRAALASFASRSGQSSANIFSHDILQRTNQSSNTSGSVFVGQSSNNGSVSHRSSGSSSSNSSASGSSSSSGAPSNNFDVGLARSYANIMSASQASPLLVRGDNALTRSLSGASSPFLPQSPGLGAALGMTGSSRTPTPAHQQALNQPSFPSISRDPRDPISQSHPSLQIPSLNSIGGGQSQTLNHLNAANLAYSSRDSLALMNQGGRGPLVGPAGGLVDQTPQHLYTQYIQRQQQLAQEELLLRSAGAHGQLAAHQSMIFQQGLMSAAGYPAGYPHTLGLRSGSYQGMNRPWI